jgi:hypothetical protein
MRSIDKGYKEVEVPTASYTVVNKSGPYEVPDKVEQYCAHMQQGTPATQPNKYKVVNDLLVTFQEFKPEDRMQVLRTVLAYFDISKEDL